MTKTLVAGAMLCAMALGTASAFQAEAQSAALRPPDGQAAPLPSQLAIPATAWPPASAPDFQHDGCPRAGLMRLVGGGDPLANLRDAHRDPQRCKLSICIPASINLDLVCELTTAIDSFGRYNCRMVINDFLRLCTSSCHSGDWRWLDDYRGPY